MSATVRWGIAGTGFVAGLFAKGLDDAPGARLVAVASRQRSRAEAFAARFGVPNAHGSYDELAGDREVDVVYVATPHSEHRPNALLMLDAGKAVLCEKPFSLDANEAREIIALARKKGVFCMEAMWTRFLPAAVELVDRVRGGELGEVQSATFELGHPFAMDPTHRLFNPALGGGALLDLGVYGVSFGVWLFGPPGTVQSQVLIGSSGVDEHVAAILGHPGGRQSLIAASLRTRLSNGASIAGTEGWGRLQEPLYRPPAFSIVHAPRQPLVRTSHESDPSGPAGARGWIDRAIRALRLAAASWASRTEPGWIARPYRGNGYGYQAVEVIRCMRAGLLESPVMPLDESLVIMDALDAIRKNWKVL
ncbi:MAG TPA: Gfo/Idh/MocA family oxidoreductase [Polyangiaceae bacterium]|nr:Gfo/Idh/MocA family oxidoreductase [Polyangiaceae bacterium]